MGRKKSITNRGSREKDKQRKRANRKQIQESFLYHPVGNAWREARGADLGLPVSVVDGETINTAVIAPTPLLPPTSFYQTLPDGNCFFNALSYVITGYEHFQHIMRRAICTQLIRFQDDLRTYVPSRYNGDVQQYLIGSQMIDDRTWATETEIFAAAHLLRTNIFVYTRYGARWTWLRHGPRNPVSDAGIYLYHRDRNHYDVVTGIQNVPSDLQKERKLKKSERDKSTYAKDCAGMKERAKSRYKTDDDYRERKKRKTNDKYATDMEYKERFIMTQNRRYATDRLKFRETSRMREKAKYRKDKLFRDKKKSAAKERYWTKEAYRRCKKAASMIKYSMSSEFRHCVRKYSAFKYKENRTFRDKVRMLSAQKYKDSKKLRESVKDYSRRKYKDNKDFRAVTKEYSKRKYKENNDFRARLKASTIKSMLRDPCSEKDCWKISDYSIEPTKIFRQRKRKLFRVGGNHYKQHY